MKLIVKFRIWQFCLLLCFGCTEVYFTDVQPYGKKHLKEIPPDMQGWFVEMDGADTIHIRTRGFDMTDEYASLSDSVVLTKWKDYYFLNISDNSKNLWEIYLVQKVNAYEMKVSFIDGENSTDIEALKSLIHITPYEKEDGSINYYVVSPSSKEFKNLVKNGVFKSEIRYRRIY